VETRIVVKQDDHWTGYSYAWNDGQTDAVLVGRGGMDRTYLIKTAQGTRPQSWHYPSRTECMFCHSRAAGFVLGLNTMQMNTSQQLAKLSAAGVFQKPPDLDKQHPAYPDPFGSAPLEERARAYLAVNCAMCHVSDGGGNARIDLAFATKLADTRMVGERPIHDAFDIADSLLVAPGDPDRSVLHQRLRRRGTGQMPPTSTGMVDEAGARLVADWILSLR
jgi:mono/diheme cytochrome c family protein